MIVVIIVGILASLAVPRFITATRKAKEAEARNILGVIRTSQIRYYLENRQNYSTDITLLDCDITPSQYFTYSAIDSGGDIGQAAGTGADVSNFRIDVNGTITTY
jgi:type II secretory pathway pseudopilin PulG